MYSCYIMFVTFSVLSEGGAFYKIVIYIVCYFLLYNVFYFYLLEFCTLCSFYIMSVTCFCFSGGGAFLKWGRGFS